MQSNRIGYCAIATNEKNLDQFNWLKELASSCEQFVLGIANDYAMARLYNDGIVYSAMEMQQFWTETGWFTKVLILDDVQLSYQNVYNCVHFDLCVYGTEYGERFLNDCQFMKKENINFIPIACDQGVSDSLRLVLDSVQHTQKLVLFGTGHYFDLYMDQYGNYRKPDYVVDNDSSKWNTSKGDVKIINPDVLRDENTDEILVIICCKKFDEIKKQLISMGIRNYRLIESKKEISILEEFSITLEAEKQYIQNSHRILINLLKEFDDVCQKNHLRYYLICGTLIGAIRHQGMIPWDDDIDLAMPRADFIKLRKIAKQVWNEKNDTFLFQEYGKLGGGAFLDCMQRLYYLKEKLPTKCFDKANGKAKVNLANRMFLDIYVMDNAHENDYIHRFCIGAMKGIYNLMMGHRALLDYDEYRQFVSEKMIGFMKVLHRIGGVLPIRLLAFLYDAFARSGNWNKNASDYIMESCAIRCIELKYPRSYFGEGLRLPFENIEAMVPTDYDAQLKSMRYHDYMNFPRCSIRKPSHYFNSDITIT